MIEIEFTDQETVVLERNKENIQANKTWGPQDLEERLKNRMQIREMASYNLGK